MQIPARVPVATLPAGLKVVLELTELLLRATVSVRRGLHIVHTLTLPLSPPASQEPHRRSWPSAHREVAPRGVCFARKLYTVCAVPASSREKVKTMTDRQSNLGLLFLAFVLVAAGLLTSESATRIALTAMGVGVAVVSVVLPRIFGLETRACIRIHRRDARPSGRLFRRHGRRRGVPRTAEVAVTRDSLRARASSAARAAQVARHPAAARMCVTGQASLCATGSSHALPRERASCCAPSEVGDRG